MKVGAPPGKRDVTEQKPIQELKVTKPRPQPKPEPKIIKASEVMSKDESSEKKDRTPYAPKTRDVKALKAEMEKKKAEEKAKRIANAKARATIPKQKEIENEIEEKENFKEREFFVDPKRKKEVEPVIETKPKPKKTRKPRAKKAVVEVTDIEELSKPIKAKAPRKPRAKKSVVKPAEFSPEDFVPTPIPIRENKPAKVEAVPEVIIKEEVIKEEVIKAPRKPRVKKAKKLPEVTHEVMYGINYKKPIVTLLQESGLGVPEFAARTCYDSFDKSENEAVKIFKDEENRNKTNLNKLNKIESSGLLNDLAWTHFHHSILEHTTLSFLIEGTSRGVLQEHARHRIQAISVRSTRYTMSDIINAFVASLASENGRDFFIIKLLMFEMFVTTDTEYNKIEAGCMWDKLYYQYGILGAENFIDIAIPKSSLDYLIPTVDPALPDAIFELLQSGKKKRNVGDAFKHLITDNVKVDMVVTFNLRSLKNYFALRDSGAAYFQIKWLAKEMKEATPKKYLDLIIKNKD